MKRWKGVAVKAPMFVALLLLFGLSGQAFSQEEAPGPPGSPFEVSSGVTGLRVTLGKSIIISVPYVIQRISVAEPGVADVVTISNDQFLLSGKAPGVTNLILWNEAGANFLFNVVVQADAETLNQGIKDLYPEEEISIQAIKDTLVISGVTEHATVKDTVGQIAESFAPKKVVNLLKVEAPPKQVSLKVQFAEVSRTGLRELGFSFLGFSRGGSLPEIGVFPGNAPATPFGNFRVPPNDTPLGPDFSVSSLVNLFVANSARDLALLIRALETRGDLKTLAEPRLVAMSGEKASFLAGGEFPVPVPQGGGTGAVTIEFKPFGVRLDFTPTVLENGRISLKLAPEVSELDFAKAVSVGGFSVPSLTKRRAETTLELASGETFAMAGFIRNRSVKSLGKLPYVSDIPMLGQLFTSERFTNEESELLVLITPELVEEAPPDEPLPVARGASLGREM